MRYTVKSFWEVTENSSKKSFVVSNCSHFSVSRRFCSCNMLVDDSHKVYQRLNLPPLGKAIFIEIRRCSCGKVWQSSRKDVFIKAFCANISVIVFVRLTTWSNRNATDIWLWFWSYQDSLRNEIRAGGGLQFFSLVKGAVQNRINKVWHF